MKKQSIRIKLALSYASIALFAALLLGGIMLTVLQRYYSTKEIEYLTDNATEIGYIIADAEFAGLSSDDIYEMVSSFSFFSNFRVRVLDKDLNVIHDSGLPKNTSIFAFDENDLEDGVFAGTIGFSVFPVEGDISDFPEELVELQGYEAVLLQDVVREYPGVAIGSIMDPAQEVEAEEPVQRSKQIVQQPYYSFSGELMGYVLLSDGPAYGKEIINSITRGWAISGLIAVGIAGLAGILVSAVFSKPIEALTHTTTRMADGDLSVRSVIQNQDEFGSLALSFNQMADRIEEKVAASKRFVADAAHQIHSPLTIIQTTLEMNSDENSELALEEVERLNTLSRNLLKLSMLESGSEGSSKTRMDFGGLILQTTELFASRAEAGGIDFRADIPSTPVEIDGNENQLRMMIQNLMDNAIKFTPSGGFVSVKLVKREGQVNLTISDSGIGIPDDDLPFLFSRFFRGRNSANFAGSGLGLAISKAIADIHDASLEISSSSEGTNVEMKMGVR